MNDNLKHLVLEMSVGMFAYVLILGILALIFQNGLAAIGFPLGPVLLGLLLGFVADALMLIHMAYVTERAVDSQDEGYANSLLCAEWSLSLPCLSWEAVRRLMRWQ